MGREPLSVAGALNDYLVAGISQAVQGAVAQDGVIKQSQPLLYRPVAGDNKAGLAVPGDNQLIEVGRLLGGKPLQPKVVHDEQVRAEEGAEGLLQGMVDS